ncbi:MAG: cobyric acid synthase [Lachnospiraceae bacterium]|nr:cobyric acid synthase [Lachnospiraceae bacterium]
MAKVIMIQGTMSNAGKSLLVAGLCRIFKQDGYRVAPFKSQNMALNSFITKEGLEMGRAQVMQAEAAGIEPMVCMNPILLKPTSHMGSQVIVNGEVLGNMKAKDYFAFKKQLIPDIKKAFRRLEEFADIIVIEGAGSPAEINLKENDIVNMGLAKLVDAPVLLVGDIDRGGVFAQLLGTLMLLEEDEKQRVKGLIINKFRGDKSILDPGVEMLEERGRVPVTGVVPYMELSLEDEDSLTERFEKRQAGCIDLAVIRYPRISNFTDFNVFEQMPEISVRYVTSVQELQQPDLIFLPGSKNTIEDLKWMRQNGLEAAIKKRAGETPVFGICGGYQMLGCRIDDPEGVEEKGAIRGMELLPVATILKKEKVRQQVEGEINSLPGIFAALSGVHFEGYEIHMGETQPESDVGQEAFKQITRGQVVRIGQESKSEKVVVVSGTNQNVYGSYVHGLFDRGEIASAVVQALAEKKGIVLSDGTFENYQDLKEKQYDKLAATLREYLNMEEIYGMLREASLD